MWLFGVLLGADPDTPCRRRRNQTEHLCGSPLATSLTVRGMARWAMGLDGWTEDFDRALAMARMTDPVSQATLVAYKYVGLSRMVLLADDAALAEIDEALQVAEQSSKDIAVVLVRLALGTALIYHDGGDRQRIQGAGRTPRHVR
jgi:adenylate cyclase